MAKGDIITGVLNNSSFQPVAGIEIIITSVTNAVGGGLCTWSFYNGAERGHFASPQASSGTLASECNTLAGITNTVYIHTVHNGGYSGVQVK